MGRGQRRSGDNDDNDDNDVFSHTQVTQGQGLHICQNNTELLTKYVNSLLYDPRYKLP